MKEKTRDLVTVMTLVFIASLVLIIFVSLLSETNRNEGSGFTPFKADTIPLVALLAGVSLGSLIGLIIAQKIVVVGSGLLESAITSKNAEIKKAGESFAFAIATMLQGYINGDFLSHYVETYIRHPGEYINRVRFWNTVIYIAEGLARIRRFELNPAEIVLANFISRLSAMDKIAVDEDRKTAERRSQIASGEGQTVPLPLTLSERLRKNSNLF